MEKRVRFALVPVLGAVLLGCPSPQEICRSGVDQVCERVHECQPDAVKASAQFQAAFGTSEADCKTKLYANPLAPQGAQGIACDNVDDDPKICANLGQPQATDFDLSKGSDCRDARAKLSCEAYLAQLSDPTLAPAACGQRCK
jgi:hypothetical protein